MRLCSLGRCASALSAATTVSSYALSLVALPDDRLYFGTSSPAALSHFLTVFLDSPVRLAISLLLMPSRSFMRRTLPIISMVITFGLLLPKNSAVA